jgi:predicted NAD-dependent protein-ADP-ribosyltransferase YbiA (DUF1768 family)
MDYYGGWAQGREVTRNDGKKWKYVKEIIITESLI